MNYEKAWNALKCTLLTRGEWMFFDGAEDKEHSLFHRLNAIDITLEEMTKLEERILKLVKP